MDRETGIPLNILRVCKDDTYFGRMNDASGTAYAKGLCGDEMEFYIVVADDRITEIKYYTEGCSYTKACACVACSLAFNRLIEEALGISAGQVAAELNSLPREYLHCSILAVTTLYKAIADYLLKP